MTQRRCGCLWLSSPALTAASTDGASACHSLSRHPPGCRQLRSLGGRPLRCVLPPESERGGGRARGHEVRALREAERAACSGLLLASCGDVERTVLAALCGVCEAGDVPARVAIAGECGVLLQVQRSAALAVLKICQERVSACVRQLLLAGGARCTPPPCCWWWWGSSADPLRGHHVV